MKLPLLLLLISMLNSFTDSTFSQSTKISLHLKNVTVEEVLNEIEKKSDFYFLFNQQLVDVNRIVDVNAENEPLKNILDNLFKGTNVEYFVFDRQIILSPKGMSESFDQLHKKKIKGTVTDAGTGEPLPGVNITIEGTTIGTITDKDGDYTVNLISPDMTLVFSFIGYKTEKIEVTGKTNIDVKLQLDIHALKEVVVIGYGTIRKTDMTGAISSIKTNNIPVYTVTSIDHILQGRVAGLNLTVNSAQLGSNVLINIRGAISPNGSNAPLYVIDGLPLTDNRSTEPSIIDKDLGYYGGVDRDPLNSINPSDIESIDILKDASAAAIYGSAAANGVILITTKKGKEGGITVDYRGTYSVQTPKKYFDLLDATDFMLQNNRLTKEVFLFDNGITPYGNTDPNAVSVPYVPKFTLEQINQAGKGTDWLGLLTRRGTIQEHNLSINGGSKNTRVYTSFNIYDNKAILENSDFIRYSGRMNLDQHLGKSINLSIKFTFSQSNSNNASTGANAGGVEKYNMLQAAYTFSPTIPVFDEEGNYTKSFDRLITNPAAFLIINDKIRNNRFLVIPNIEIKILDGLKLNFIGGIDKNNSTRNFYLPRKVDNAQLPQGMAQLGTGRIDNYSAEGYLTYQKKFINSNLIIMAGTGYYKTLNDGFQLQGVGFFTDALGANNVQTASDKLKNIIESYKDQRTKLSQFFRINYSLHDKYILSLVGRNDGSSIFSPKHKYGFFPAISGAWRIGQEPFMQTPFLSDMKIRAGYGVSGNENVLSGNTLQLYSRGSNPGFMYLIGNTVYSGVALSQIKNDNLKWESDYTLNLGLDFGLWNQRLSGSFDYYIRTARDLLDYLPLPSSSPVGQVVANVGATRSIGYELSLFSNNILSKNFSWNTNFTLSSYHVFWLKRNKAVTIPGYVGEHDGLHDFYGWKTDGIIKNKQDIPSYMPAANLGNVKYLDLNNDGKLDSKDVVKLGNTDPKWGFGLENIFRYKKIDLNIYIYGYIKRWAYYGYNPYQVGTPTVPSNTAPVITANIIPPIATGTPSNTLTSIKNIWSSDNPNGTLPGIASDAYAGSNPAQITDFDLQDASFARIKNITLGYTLSLNRIKKYITSARIYIDLQNVAVLSKYKGFDPEYSNINPYPQAFITSVGINLTF